MTAMIPDYAELEFAVYQPTGTVHVLQYVPQPYMCLEVDLEKVSFGEGLMAMWTTPRRMLCGKRFVIGFPGARGEWTDCFEDDAFCVRCIRALGDQSPRAFEHCRPGDVDDR